MSLCAECFQKGNHDGHDFNMFRYIFKLCEENLIYHLTDLHFVNADHRLVVHVTAVILVL